MRKSSYNQTFDFIIAGLMSARKGKNIEAGKHFAQAVKSKDLIAAIRTLEANNQRAFEAERAEKVVKAQKAQSKVSAKKRLRAEDLDDEVADDVDEDVDEDLDLESDLDEDLDEEVEDDVEEDEDEDDAEEVDSSKRAATFAKVLASMRKKRIRK